MIRDGKRSINRDLDRFLGSIGLSTERNKLSVIGLKNSKSRVLYNGQRFGTADFVSSTRDRGSKERMRAGVEMAKGFYRVPDDHDDEADIIELENFRMLNNGQKGSLPKRTGGLALRFGGYRGKAKKNVSFAEDGDRSRVFVSTRETKSNEDGSVDEEEELVDNLSRRIQKIAAVSKENGDDDQDAYSEGEESSQTSSVDENSKRGSKAEGNHQGGDVDFVFSAPMPLKMESGADLMKTRKA